MKTLLKFLFFLFIGQVLSAQATNLGTAEEAIAMVKRATALIDKKGKDEAIKQFNEASGPFVDRDLYIAVLDEKGIMVAHGANPRLIGKSLLEMKDADGKTFIKSLIDTAQKHGSGWVEYKWPNPVTKAIESKSTYVEKAGALTVACGIYKK
ncbi:histidine kinase [Rugamonas sp. FT82W]|uniref:Histidine kinase n=1 Tax=Duganella vulcania TaxID=2692166 RepID=A0A845G9R0_9BURK|nr:cache domain-containing protein [Duganella vulcania]MYM90182.1 histidine kinase [Duganella vulcania]